MNSGSSTAENVLRTKKNDRHVTSFFYFAAKILILQNMGYLRERAFSTRIYSNLLTKVNDFRQLWPLLWSRGIDKKLSKLESKSSMAEFFYSFFFKVWQKFRGIPKLSTSALSQLDKRRVLFCVVNEFAILTTLATLIDVYVHQSSPLSRFKFQLQK